jgi:hypothetical protein
VAHVGAHAERRRDAREPRQFLHPAHSVCY